MSAARERGLLKMSELAERSGVSAGTIKHYLREGLLPEPVKTSRNMAYYPPEFVDRIKLIKQLQEERFMPLRAIKSVLDEDPERARALVELEDRILDRALAGERTRTSAAEVRERYGVPKDVLDLDEALDSELARARQMVVEMDQPQLGTVRQLGVPVKMSRTPADPTRPAPAFGEHTNEVLGEVGYSTEEIAQHLEISVAAVLTRLFRARQVLRHQLLGAEGSRS